MSTSPLLIDRTYVVSFEYADEIVAEAYIERQPAGQHIIEIAADTERDRFLMFVLCGLVMRSLRQDEEDLATKVKMLSWSQILNSVASEEEVPPSPTDNTSDIPF